MTDDYLTQYEKNRKAEAEAHRNYWLLQVHWAPFQGPDKLRSVKLAGVAPLRSHTWTQFQLKTWKPETKPTKTTTEHVDLSRRIFHSPEGYEFTFWALAPVQPGLRSKWQNNMHCEFVWLVLDGTNGRGVHIALVEPDTGEVRWWRETADHYMPKEVQLSA